MDLIGEERGRLARVAGWLDASRSETTGLTILLLGTLVATVVVVWSALGRPDVLPVDGDGAAIGAAPGAIGEDGEVVASELPEGPHADDDAVDGPAHGPGGDGHGASPTDEGLAVGEVVVHVVGAVGDPGVVAVPAGARVADAIDEAGGLAADADPMRLNLARPVVDGERLVVLREGEEPPEELAGPDAAGTPADHVDGAPGGAPDAPVDLNRADQATLETLPGIGPAIAGRIVDHREQHGPFRQPGDLRDVSGIGEKRFQDLADRVTVG